MPAPDLSALRDRIDLVDRQIIALLAERLKIVEEVAMAKLDAASLTLRNAWGRNVTLSLRPSGDLEARFGRASGSPPQGSGVAGLVVVNADGREVARLGEPTSRQLGQ